MADRTELRANILGRTGTVKRIIELEGVSYEVRKPGIRDRSIILRAGGIKARSGNGNGETTVDLEDYGKALVVAALHCTYVPGTEMRVFDPADLDALMLLPSGSAIEVLGAAVMELMNAPTPEKKASPTSPSDSSSIASPRPSDAPSQSSKPS